MKTTHFTFSASAPGDTDKKKNLGLYINLMPSARGLTPLQAIEQQDAVNYTGQALKGGMCGLELQFGLQRAGSLQIDRRFELPQVMLPQPGSGPSQSHPSTMSEIEDCKSIAKEIFTELQHAIDTQIHAKGYFQQPFMIRYALRHASGQYLWASAPILMLPSVQAPFMAVSQSVGAHDNAVIAFDANTMPYFELRCRIARGIDAERAQGIAGIDIFISEEVKTYDSANISTLGITSYLNVIAESSTGWTHRGRSDLDPVVGHWSAQDDNYQAQRLSVLATGNLQAWHINPNCSMPLQLATLDHFYKIATLPVNESWESGDFFTIPISSTYQKSIISLPQLPRDVPDGCEYDFLTSLKTCGYWYHGGCIKSLEKPQSLLSLSSARSLVAGQETIAVFIHTPQGIRCACKSRADVSLTNLADDFPRFLYYPDKAAYKMAIQTSQGWHVAPLCPHSSLPGAYWMGDLDDTTAPPALSQEEAAMLASEIAAYSTAVESAKILFCSNLNTPWLISEKIEMESDIMRVMPAMKSMSQGQFGAFPLYAFCRQGIWAISAGAKSCQQISALPPLSPEAIAMIGSDVAFISGNSIMQLSGTTLTDITPSEMSLQMLSRLNLANSLIASDLPQLSSFLPSCSLRYDESRKILIASSHNSSAQYIYHLEHQQWCIYLQGTSQIAITEPLLLDKNYLPMQVSAARIIGEHEPGACGLLLYGSNDLHRWTMIANSALGIEHDMHGEPYRHIVAIIASQLKKDENIQALILNLDNNEEIF